MKITAREYAEILYDSVDGKTKAETSLVLKKFADILVKNNNLSFLNRIIDNFNAIWNKRKNIVEVNIVRAYKHDKKTTNSVKDYVKGVTGADKIVISEEINSEIVGGIIIKYLDKVLDGSIKTGLKTLKREMIR